MKALRRSLLAAAIVATLGLLAGCNSSTPSGVPITISLSASPSTVNPGQTSTITATVSNDTSNSGVSWSLSGGGALSNQTPTTVTYTAPSATCQQVVSITATSKASSNATASVQVTVNGILVSLVAIPTTINLGGSTTITANVTGDPSNSGVTWSQPAVGSLSNITSTSATYTAPASGPTEVVITATSKAASCAAASTQITVIATGAAPNVQAINVDGGPVPIYANGSFASATVCVPGAVPPASCVTVDGLLVDTGSQGLRVLQTALNGLALQPIQLGGQSLNDCVSFADGSFLWGQVDSADVHIAGETASNIPIHVVADPNGFSIPAACSANGGIDEDNLQALLANGILGVGSEPTDCELAGANFCDGSQGTPVAIYWTCSSSACTANPVTVPIAQQVTNPVVAFATDNNGVVLSFPPVTAPSQPTVTGTMTFGIGTQANNGLGSATIYTLDSNDFFQTTFNLDTELLPFSFIDSGSNGYFIPDPNGVINICSDFTSFFCPPATVNTSGQNVGANNNSGTVLLSIDNTDGLFANSTDAAYPTLGGPNGTTACTNGGSGFTGACSFDWGLPFFYGNTVFTSIDGQAVPGGFPAPWWAY